MSLGEQLDFTFQPMRRIFTVRDLVSAIRTQLEREYTDVWVEGEISNYRSAESGHLYFTLKDDASQLRVVIWRTQARLLRFKPENGLQVIARGRVTVYDQRGELQLSADYLEPKGAGALQIAFEQLKAKLAAEGLFDRSRKKAIPRLPRRIGIVTSPRGAALQDMLNILRRRHEDVGILIYPAQVQGDAAALEVATGVKYFNRAKNVDVIVLARGGGSLEDLMAFNDEGLARTIAASEIPVISAVGHETDFTIADFVADMRAPTPSAAAELVIESKRLLEEQVATLRRRLARGAQYQLQQLRLRLTQLAQHGAFASMREAIRRRDQRVDELRYRLAQAERKLILARMRRLDVASTRLRHLDLRLRLNYFHKQLDTHASGMTSAVRNLLARRRATLEHLTAQLKALSPTNILERGYALVFDAEGKLVKNAAQVQPGQDISAQVADGKITATVKRTEN
ncbi:MAG TPA: exodeoxyribonuclease VII large subunit [Terriglobales bacterium]|nr:exodeoxyribonuclease VII large subunit [Terriglobales bacterium]